MALLLYVVWGLFDLGAWRSPAAVESRNYVVVTRASSALRLATASAAFGVW